MGHAYLWQLSQIATIILARMDSKVKLWDHWKFPSNIIIIDTKPHSTPTYIINYSFQINNLWPLLCKK